MREYLKNTLNDSTKLYNFTVILLNAIISIPIAIREAFSQNVKYYRIDNFFIEEIANYQISIGMMFLVCIIIIHANKLLLILTDLIGLIIPAIERKLGIIRDSSDDYRGGV